MDAFSIGYIAIGSSFNEAVPFVTFPKQKLIIHLYASTNWKSIENGNKYKTEEPLD